MKTVEQRYQYLLDQRYGDQQKPANIIWNTQIEGIMNHRSVRHFLSAPLPDGAIATMVAAAQSASVSSNLHQWSVIAVTDPVLKSKLSEVSRKDAGGVGNPYIDQAPVLLLWVADLSRNNALACAAGMSTEVHAHLDAFVMATIDATIAAQTAAIAAESIGLGIVYIGAMRNQAKEIADLLGLPDFSYVTFGMVVGKPDPEHSSDIRPRPAQEVVLHYNAYDAEKSIRGLDLYEAPFQVFREKQGMKPKNWKTEAIDSAVNMEYMHGRQHLREAVEERGFTLR